MKAKLLIEPGCEAGSEFCGGCWIKDVTGFDKASCRQFKTKSGRNRKLKDGERTLTFYRCQDCLDAEQKPTKRENAS